MSHLPSQSSGQASKGLHGEGSGSRQPGDGGNDEERRKRNNESVRRSREKKKRKDQEMRQQYIANERRIEELQKQVDDLSEELKSSDSKRRGDKKWVDYQKECQETTGSTSFP